MQGLPLKSLDLVKALNHLIQEINPKGQMFIHQVLTTLTSYIDKLLS
jgi:hypothetical protein